MNVVFTYNFVGIIMFLLGKRSLEKTGNTDIHYDCKRKPGEEKKTRREKEKLQ